jgi:hypothetical protein
VSTLDNIRRGELKRLLIHRRAASKVKVANMVEDILGERVRWTSAALGQRLSLTFAEKVRLGIRTLHCVDRTKKDMKLYHLERRRERDRRRKRNVRTQTPKEMNGCLSARARKLAATLNSDWMSGYRLLELIEKKWRLKHDAARKAMRRAVIELIDARVGFEQKIETGPRGGYQTFIRLRTRGSAEKLGFSERRSARSAGKIRAARSGDTNLSSGTFPGGTKTCPLTEEVQENWAQVEQPTVH